MPRHRAADQLIHILPARHVGALVIGLGAGPRDQFDRGRSAFNRQLGNVSDRDASSFACEADGDRAPNP